MNAKKFGIIILSVMLLSSLVLFTGCGKSDSSESDSEVAAEEQTKNYDKALEWKSRGVLEGEWDDGYTFKAEIFITDWMRAEDWDTIQDTYDKFMDDNDWDPYVTCFEDIADDANQQKSAVVLGAVRIDNTTKKWDLSEENPHRVTWRVGPREDYIDQEQSSDLYGTILSRYIMAPGDYYKWEGDLTDNTTWFLFSITSTDAFSPKHPDGIIPSGNFSFNIPYHTRERAEIEFPLSELAN